MLNHDEFAGAKSVMKRKLTAVICAPLLGTRCKEVCLVQRQVAIRARRKRWAGASKS
jgi:hypothetical protein